MVRYLAEKNAGHNYNGKIDLNRFFRTYFIYYTISVCVKRTFSVELLINFVYKNRFKV